MGSHPWSRALRFAPLFFHAFAARVAFAISPSSAACERVFALVKIMFGELQMSALSDMLQAALMLRSNGRRVG